MWEQPGGSSAATPTLGGHARAWFLLGEAEGPQEEPAQRGLQGSGHCDQQRQALLPTLAGEQASREGCRASLTTEPSPILRKKHNTPPGIHVNRLLDPFQMDGSQGFQWRRTRCLHLHLSGELVTSPGSTLTSVASRASLMRLTRFNCPSAGPRAPTAHHPGPSGGGTCNTMQPWMKSSKAICPRPCRSNFRMRMS